MLVKYTLLRVCLFLLNLFEVCMVCMFSSDRFFYDLRVFALNVIATIRLGMWTVSQRFVLTRCGRNKMAAILEATFSN